MMEERSQLLAQTVEVDPSDKSAVDFLQFQEAIYGVDNNPDNIFIDAWDNFVDGFLIETFSTPGGIITRFLPFLLTGAGIILFVMLIWGGFEIMMGAATPKSAESGKQRITSALIGFFILFSVYWIAQIVQTIFGINIGIQ